MRTGVAALLQGEGETNASLEDRKQEEKTKKRKDVDALLRSSVRKKDVQEGKEEKEAWNVGLDAITRNVQERNGSVATTSRSPPWQASASILLRFSSKDPFPDVASGIRSFQATRRFTASEWESHGTLEPQVHWKQSCLYWTSCASSKKEWDHIFREAYSSYRHFLHVLDRSTDVVHNAYLLIQHPIGPVLFMYQGKHSEPTVVFSRSTTGIRKKLSSFGVIYSCLNHESKQEDVFGDPAKRKMEGVDRNVSDEQDWLHGNRVLDLALEKERNSKRTILFRGEQDVHGAYEFLLEEGFSMDETKNAVQAWIYSNVPYVGASVGTLEQETTVARDASKENHEQVYFATFRERNGYGWIPPWTMQSLLTAASRGCPNGFEVEIHTDTTTDAFRIASCELQEDGNAPPTLPLRKISFENGIFHGER